MFPPIAAGSRGSYRLSGNPVIRCLQFLAAAALLTACSNQKPKILGVAFDETTVPVAAAKRAETGTRVSVQGKMTEKCPAAGCWFLVRDGSGGMKVDTKTAGFVVVDVPLGTPVTVAGRVATNGTDCLLSATGLRY